MVDVRRAVCPEGLVHSRCSVNACQGLGEQTILPQQLSCDWTADRGAASGFTCLRKQEPPPDLQLPRPADVQTVNRNQGSSRFQTRPERGPHCPGDSQEAMTEVRMPPPPLPPRLDWFVQTQMGQLAHGGVPAWFHGAISREDAENLLESQPLGSFLIRVSHSHVGYTLSYKAQNCCRHFMVKLLDTGNFVIPGEKRTHDSLSALVAFHQQQPVWPHGDLLTQPCGQKDPANADYEDLFLYSNSLTEEASWPAHEPSLHQNHSSSEQASPMSVLPHQPKERKLSAEVKRALPEKAASPFTPKAPLEEACQKLWKNLKMLPQTGKKVQQQLKSHLTVMSSPLPWDARRVTGNQDHSGDKILGDNVYTDPFVSSFPVHSSKPQDPRNTDAHSRKVLRSASCGEVCPKDNSLHQTVERSLSSQVCKPKPENLAQFQKGWVPEEYHPPPPFAPGYC